MNTYIILLIVLLALFCSSCRSNWEPPAEMSVELQEKMAAELHDLKSRILQLHQGMDRNSVETVLKPITPLFGADISGMYFYSAYLNTNVFVNLEFTSQDILWAMPDRLMVSTKPYGFGDLMQVRFSEIK